MFLNSTTSALERNREQTVLHEKWKSDYITLNAKLKSLAVKLEEDAHLPIGPKAFVIGKIIHTNEITCLLGDNWFLECNTKNAVEIVDRRIQRCDVSLEKLKEELNLAQGWADAASQHMKERTDTVEIREVYDEEKELEWRKIHRQKVQEYHKTLAITRNNL